MLQKGFIRKPKDGESIRHHNSQTTKVFKSKMFSPFLGLIHAIKPGAFFMILAWLSGCEKEDEDIITVIEPEVEDEWCEDDVTLDGRRYCEIWLGFQHGQEIISKVWGTPGLKDARPNVGRHLMQALFKLRLAPYSYLSTDPEFGFKKNLAEGISNE